MKLGVVGRATDPLSVHTAEIARDLGHEVVAVQFADAAVSSDAHSWLVNGVELDACDAFVVRRYPNLYAQLGPAEEMLSGAEQWKRTMQQVERASFAQSALIDLERRGTPMVNPLLASQAFDFKPLQLATFQRAGVPIPATVVTNFAGAVPLFRQAVGEIIAKPAAGGAEAVVVDDATDLAALHAAGAPPVIFQERVYGDDVRATVVGDRVVSAVVIASDTLDYRTGAAYRAGNASYRSHDLPAETAALAVKCAQLCGHVLSGVDLKRKQDGSYVVIEANSGPVYLDIEQKTGAPITRAVVEWLASRVLAR